MSLDQTGQARGFTQFHARARSLPRTPARKSGSLHVVAKVVVRGVSKTRNRERVDTSQSARSRNHGEAAS